MRYAILLITGLLFMAFDQAPMGTVAGVVRNQNGGYIPNAKISILGSSDTFFSDTLGQFSILVAEGKNTLLIEAQGFEAIEKNVEIRSEEISYIEASLQAKSTGTVFIHQNKVQKTSTVKWSLESKRLNGGTVEILTAEDLGKTTVSNTGEALKRIPGATIMEGKFANIRGMYDRYNSGYLNGAMLPSTESDRKAFSFDMIPSGLLDNIVVIKTASPDLSGDFGGGIIRINTKSIPSKFTQNISLGFKTHSLTGFRSMESMQALGSMSAIFGGSMPNIAVSKSTQEAGAETQKFNNDWSIRTFKAMPTPRFVYSLGVPFKLKNKREFGMTLSMNYALNQTFSQGRVKGYDLSDNRLKNSGNDNIFKTNIQGGALANFSYKPNENHSLDFRNLYTLTYDASTLTRKGVSDHDDQKSMEGYSSQEGRNRLLSTQINGTHNVGKYKTKIEWLLNYGSTKREIPDYRIAQYSIIEDSRYLVFNDFFNSGSGRFFSSLNEGVISGNMDIAQKFNWNKTRNIFKTGIYYQNRNRDFSSREFVYGPNMPYASNATPEQDLSAENMASKGIILIEKTSKDADEYSGHSALKAAYAMLENQIPVSIKNKTYIKLVYGARIEQFSQVLGNAYFDKLGRDLVNTGRTTDILPSINVAIPVRKANQLRLSYGKTLNRPEMRELAPFSFYNFSMNSEIMGNKDLKRAQIHNFDARYEIYSGKEGMLTIGSFFKRLINPIEFSLDPTQAQIRTFTFRNERSAEIKGIEIELRNNLGETFRRNALRNFSFCANAALIKSSVQFMQKNTGMNNRSLQGQSPYVLNFSLFYNSEKTGWQFNTSFNRIGSRIAYIGLPKSVQPFGMDIYEKGRSVLEFQAGKTFGKNGTLKLSVSDAIAQDQVFYQDVNADKKYNSASDNTLFRYNNGMSVTLGYSLQF